jgi:hypothetical protein
MRWLALAVLVACGGGNAAVDAPHGPPRDGPLDGDVDAPVDGGPDAPPDAPFSTVSPACATTPVPLIDVSPRRISNFVIAGNTVYLGVFRLEATVVDTAVLAIDATTGAEVASPLGTTGVTSVWKVGADV